MAKQAEPTHRRIPYRVRVRLKALGRLCAHSSASVAAAAHKEIGAIHRKYLLGRASRMRAWFGNLGRAGVRKVTPKQLHGPLRVKAGAPQQQAPKRGQATPIRAHMPKDGFTPLTDHTLTRAELRQRTKAAKAARRSGQPVPQPARPQPARAAAAPPRQPDAMQQATDTMRRAHQPQEAPPSPGRPDQTAPSPERTSAPSRNGQAMADVRQSHREARAARRGSRAKGGSWRGLDGRVETPAPSAPAPERTTDTRLPSERVADNTRSRTRTTA
jgi:hypothetical protein